MQLERHHLSKQWPDIPDAQFQELVADISKHGQRYPIVIYDGKIIDGWHRYRACLELKIKPKIEKFCGNAQSASDLVGSLNAQRRNVSESQRAFAITGCNEWAVGQQRGVARATPVSEKSKKSATNEEMAEKAGTSQDTIIRAKKVHKSGSKALKEAVQSGEVSIKKAAAVVDLPKSEQLAAATKKPEKPPVDDDRWEPDHDEDAALELAEKELNASIDKVMQSDDRLAAAHAEIKRQAAEIAKLKLSRDGFMNGKNAINKMLKTEQRKVEKLQKQLDRAESDLEKLRERISIMEAA